ncbi:MAG: MarR family transcriptional regulator [Flavobacteriales bacterium]
MSDRFEGLDQQAWSGLLRTYAQLDQAIDADLQAKHGIRHTEFEVLLRLRVAPGGRLRVHDIAGESLLTRSGTSRLIDRLAKAGLVERAGAPEDGRGSYAVLTQSGRELFDKLRPGHVAFVRERFLDRLTREEIAVLARVWGKLLVDSPGTVRGG